MHMVDFNFTLFEKEYSKKALLDFLMEYKKGIPIEYVCDERDTDIEDFIKEVKYSRNENELLGSIFEHFSWFNSFSNLFWNAYTQSYGFISIQKEADGKFGFIGTHFKEIVPCIYDDIGGFDGVSYMWVKMNGKYGFVNERGNLVIPCIYDDIVIYHSHCVATLLKDGLRLKFDLSNLEKEFNL